MKKLYYVSRLMDVVFFGEEKDAAHFLKLENIRVKEQDVLKIKELSSLEQVPEGWRNAVYWGDNTIDHSVSDYFADLEKEEFKKAKEIYLKLKDKYERK